MTAGDLRESVHARLLSIRNLFTVVASAKFAKAWSLANEDQRDSMTKIVADGDPGQLSALIRRLLQDCLGDLPVRELRKVAQECGIKGYNTLPKISLLSALAGHENEDCRPAPGRDAGTPDLSEGLSEEAPQA